MSSKKAKRPAPAKRKAPRKRKPAKTAEVKTGRPSAYDPAFAAQAEKLCKLGATDVDLADFFGIAITTVSNWKTRYPQFLEALKAGKDFADDRVERSLYQRATGYTFDSEKIFLPKDSRRPVRVAIREHCPPDVVACIFWLKNRRKDAWRDRHEHTGADGGPHILEVRWKGEGE